MALIVKEALTLLRSSLPSTIEIHHDIAIPPEGGIIRADPTLIHQVRMNLCTNAAHAMRSKGGVLGVSLTEVKIDASFVSRYPTLTVGPYMKLTVSDTGNGTIFDVYLPRYEEEMPPPAAATEALSRGHERILFVDDEITLVEPGKEMLEFLGYTVDGNTSSITSLRGFGAEPDAYDLVITDLTMPGLTGLELAKELLAIRPGIPIILCTGLNELANHKMAEETEIRALLMKPYIIPDLAKMIRSVLDQR